MPIGGFQVLQHRMVDMYMELEQSVAAVYLAVLNLDAEPEVRARAVSAAKVTIGRAARFIGQNAITTARRHDPRSWPSALLQAPFTALQYEFVHRPPPFPAAALTQG